MATIELVDIAHAYVPGQYAVQDINLKWEHGVSSALLGPSGCGKTTLLKIISGLLRPTEGRVLLDGKDVTELSPKERNIAQVFQFPVVYETLNVYDNLAFPLRNRGVAKGEVDERVRQVAAVLDLTPQLKDRANRLGAAEKQLISLGRGIVRKDMAAILLDEPLTVIDPHLKLNLRRKLKQLQRNFDFTMVYVTHDQQEALTFADQVTVMNMGYAVQTGSPEALHDHPAAPFVGYFIGSPGMNVFPAQLQGNTLSAQDFQMTLAPADVQQMKDKTIELGIRPEFIQVSTTASEGSFPAEVAASFLTGNAKVLDLHGKGLSFKARVSDESPIQQGQTVYVTFPQRWLMVYADDRVVDLHQPEGETA